MTLMKKIFFSTLLIFCCLTVTALFTERPACADPPEDVTLSYDVPKQTLTVTITHKSFFTGLHYVKEVQITLNQKPVEKKEYSSQPGKTSFAYAYKIPAVVNDVFEATAFCNLQGKKNASLTVGAEKP